MNIKEIINNCIVLSPGISSTDLLFKLIKLEEFKYLNPLEIRNVIADMVENKLIGIIEYKPDESSPAYIQMMFPIDYCIASRNLTIN